jgi:PAS domain S-box-containing protein
MPPAGDPAGEAAAAIGNEPDPHLAGDRSRATDQFQTIFNSVTDGIVIFEPGGRILEANPVVCSRLGYSREELLGMSIMDLDSPGTAALFEGRMRTVLRDRFATFDVEHTRRDGSVMPLEVGSRVIDFEGKTAILSVQRDITARRKAEAEAEAQRRYIEELLEAIPTPIIAKDLEGRIQQCNSAFLKALGRTRSEVIGSTVREMGLANSDHFEALDQEVIESGEVRQQEAWTPTATGTGRMLLTRAPMKTGDGSVRGTITTAMDITERYMAEQALRKSEERFRTLFEKAGDAIFIVDTTGRFLEANKAAADSLGYTPEELRQMSVPDIRPPG